MTKKSFILAGLFLVFLSSLLMVLETYLVFSDLIIVGTGLYTGLFRFFVIPLIFCFLLWKRLRHVGRPRSMTAFCLAGFVVVFFAETINQVLLSAIIAELNPSDVFNSEIVAWVKSGKEGVFQFSMQAKFKMAAFNASSVIIASWPLFVVLFFGALDPRSPGGAKPFARLTKRIRKKLNWGLNFSKKMVAI